MNDKYGEILEYFITKSGPLIFNFEKYDYSCQSNIYDCNCIKIDEKNFDLIFFNNDSTIYNKKFVNLYGDVEFIECKLDVSTFIKLIDAELYKNCKDKLEFIKKINKILMNSCNAKFIIATLKKSTLFFEGILQEFGYDFIHIINGDVLIKKLFN